MNEPFTRRGTSLAFTVATVVAFVLLAAWLLLYGDIAVDLNQMR